MKRKMEKDEDLKLLARNIFFQPGDGDSISVARTSPSHLKSTLAFKSSNSKFLLRNFNTSKCCNRDSGIEN